MYGISVDKKNLLLFHNCIIYFDDDKTDKIDTYRENLLNMWNSLDDGNIKDKIEHCIMLLLSENNNNVNFNEKYPDFIAWHFSEFNVHTPLWYSEMHTNYRSKLKNHDVCLEYIKRKIDIFLLVANAKDKLFSPHIYCLLLE